MARITQQMNFLVPYLPIFFLPLIYFPTQITVSSKTSIDNVFINMISQNVISGNISASIFDHLPQFSIIAEFFSNRLFPKSNIFERDWSNFDQIYYFS